MTVATPKELWQAAYEASKLREGATNTMSGIPLEPVYGPDDAEHPGVYPYTRGPYASMYRSKLWTMRMFAGFGTVDSRIDKYTGRGYTEGNAVPYAPKYTGDAGVDFTVPVSSAITLTARVDMSALGKTWFSTVQNNSVQSVFGVPADYSKTYRDAFELLNARIGLHGERWDLTAWGRNLSNKQYLAEVIPAPEFGGSLLNSGTGRSFGMDVGYRFGK